MNIPKELILNQLIKIPAVRERAKKYHRTGISHDPTRIDRVYYELTNHVSVVSKDILELGSGKTTEIVQKAVEQGASSIAILDIERYLTNEVTDRLGINYKIYNGQKMPFESESFDLIWSNDVFEHVRFPETTVAETFRLLRPGGAVVHIIDLQDHFSYGKDEPFLALNCLKYPKWLWELMTWNRSNFVNRLRASEWVRLHETVGFTIVAQSTEPDEFIRQHYRNEKRLEYLRAYSEHDAVSAKITLTGTKDK